MAPPHKRLKLNQSKRRKQRNVYECIKEIASINVTVEFETNKLWFHALEKQVNQE